MCMQKLKKTRVFGLGYRYITTAPIRGHKYGELSCEAGEVVVVDLDAIRLCALLPRPRLISPTPPTRACLHVCIQDCK